MKLRYNLNREQINAYDTQRFKITCSHRNNWYLKIIEHRYDKDRIEIHVYSRGYKSHTRIGVIGDLFNVCRKCGLIKHTRVSYGWGQPILFVGSEEDF